MEIKAIVDEDFSNYRIPSMFIGSSKCGGKCCIEAGLPLSVCQNDGWRSRAPIKIDDREICNRYLDNPITHAIVFGGLEPMEQIDEVCDLIGTLRRLYRCSDNVVIYTGYYPYEIPKELELLRGYNNIIVKFGRYIPSRPHVYDEVLGVELASDNQYAERIS